MNREIKFRAWDFTSNVMRNDISGIRYNEDGTINQIDVVSGADILYPSKEAVLMQDTGLKDKNGVDIYDGDIVRIGSLEGIPLGAIEWDAKYAQYKIDDNDKYKFGGEYVEHHRAKSFEVIGNIYEHGHLLENESKKV